jgi:predicted metal-binding membrane protein
MWAVLMTALMLPTAAPLCSACASEKRLFAGCPVSSLLYAVERL